MAPGLAQAQEVWNGAVSQDWSIAANWDPNGIPNAGTDVFISHGTPNAPVIDGGTASTKLLSIGPIAGLATLNIINGGALTSNVGMLGDAASGEGLVTISGVGSSWTDTGNIYVGRDGGGGIRLNSGGLLKTEYTDIAVNAGSYGGVAVDGAGSVWNNTHDLFIGRADQGYVKVTNGGRVTTDGIRIADQATSHYSTLTVDGSGSAVTVASGLRIGFEGTAEMAVTNGATISSGSAELGYGAAAKGVVKVNGSGSSWTNAGILTIGNAGYGELIVANGGQVSSAFANLAVQAGSSAEVSVYGADGASWTVAQQLYVGGRGEAKVYISTGGIVTSQGGVIGYNVGSDGMVSVKGTGATWTVADQIAVGVAGTGTLDIATRGAVSSASGSIGGDNGGVGIATVEGIGSRWLMSDALTVGSFGQGTLEISQGGEVGNSNALIGRNATGVGIVKVSGAGSVWNNTGSVYIGSVGTGTVILSQAGKMAVDGNLIIGAGAGNPGFLVIGGTAGNPLAAGLLSVDTVDLRTTGSFIFNHTDTNYLFAPRFVSVGNISHLAGTTVLTGNSVGFSGSTAVSGGTLFVNGTLGGTTNVTAGGSLGGSGNLTGPVSVSGTLLGQSGQVLTMDSLVLNAGSNVSVTLGAPSTVGLFKINGNLTLDGTLNVTSGVGFGDGVYRIVDYSGSLTNNGLVVGIMPSGATGIVQTAVAKQVNLLVSGAPSDTLFWNGSITVPDGSIHGGSGVWSAGANQNWTNINGTAALAWGGKFSIFQNNPGTVTVDGAAGDVKTAGMQFIGSGWTVAGCPITLDGANGETGIRVGDGTNDAHSATISSELTGSSRLVKDDLGTLILTGANSYSGGTTIKAGTLVLGNGGTTGSIIGPIDNPGTLAFHRSDDVSFAGAISGSGSIRQIGAGKTELTGNSGAFTGTSFVETGALAVNGTLGGTMDVLAGGRLQGTGTVGSTIVRGTIAPGNSIGTLNVAGNIGFMAGSIYEVEANAAGQADKIIATGNASISGGTVKVLAGAGNYKPQTDYAILTAAGGVTGTFANVTSNLAFLDPSLSYDTNNVTLRLQRNDISFGDIGGTPNQVATGEGSETQGWGSPVFDAVVNLSADQAKDAFDQLSGEIHPSVRTAMIEDSRFVRNAVWDRLRASAGEEGRGVWGQAIGSWGHTSGNGNAARLDRSTGGLLMGIDASAGEDVRLGAVWGYSRTNIDVDRRGSSGKIDSVHLGAYAGGQWGSFGLRTGIAYSWSDLHTTRNIAFPGFKDTTRAGYNGGTFQAFGEAAYGFDLGRTKLEPYASVAYVRARTNAFTETGGDAKLSGAKAVTDVTFSTFGLRTATSFDLGSANATLRAGAGWRHAFGDATPVTAMRLSAGGSAFPIAGLPITRDAAVLDAGLDVAVSEWTSISISYSGLLGNGIADHTAKANISFKF